MNKLFKYGQETRVKCDSCGSKLVIIPDAGEDMDLNPNSSRVPVGCVNDCMKTVVSSSEVILGRSL